MELYKTISVVLRSLNEFFWAVQITRRGFAIDHWAARAETSERQRSLDS